MPPIDLPARVFQAAHRRVAPAVHRTPLLGSRTLTEHAGRSVRLKAEHLQKTGSFKVRGALNFMLDLDEGAREKGVVTVSAGNHAQAVAWAAARAEVPATVVMPEDAPRAKVRASRGYGAEVVLHGSVFDAFERALELAEEGLAFVHPFDHPRILAGQGTVALEILEELPDVGTVVIPVGGGGLSAGMAAAFRALRSDVRIVGVEPEGAAVMHRSLAAGRPVRLEAVHTIADGLGAPMAGDLTFPLVQEHLEGIVLVSDREIAGAMRFLLERTKQLLEPAGAAGVAALLNGRIEPLDDRPVVVVLSGGNVDVGRLAELLGTGEEG